MLEELLPVIEREGSRGARRASPPTTILVGGEVSGGQFAIVETHEWRGCAAPCHIHSREDEFVYVLAGRVLVQIGESVTSLGVGECLFLPRGSEHAVLAESPEARMLLLTLPAGIEGYYRELNRTRADEGDTVERLITLAARYGMTITGPALDPPA